MNKLKKIYFIVSLNKKFKKMYSQRSNVAVLPIQVAAS